VVQVKVLYQSTHIFYFLEKSKENINQKHILSIFSRYIFFPCNSVLRRRGKGLSSDWLPKNNKEKGEKCEERKMSHFLKYKIKMYSKLGVWGIAQWYSV
jgi:hypothetical protein